MFTKDNRTLCDVGEANKISFGSSAAYVTSYFNLTDRKRYNRSVLNRQTRKGIARG
jgi:hypothetical protein